MSTTTPLGREYRFKGTPAQFVAVAVTFNNRIAYQFNLQFARPQRPSGARALGVFPETEPVDPLPDAPYAAIYFSGITDASITAQVLPDQDTMLVVILPTIDHSRNDDPDQDTWKESQRRTYQEAHKLWDLLLVELKRQGWIDAPLPPFSEALEKYSSTAAKMRKLRGIREGHIRDEKVTVTRTRACEMADRISPKTAKKADPELWARWHDITYR